MRLIRTRPADPFDACVECFWFSEREAPQCAVEHMLPSGGVSLVFALHEAPLSCLPGSADGGEPTIWSRGVVHGPQGNYFLSGPKPSGAVVGVSFRPGAASAVLGVPVTELTDHHITVDALWGARGLALRERLVAAGEPRRILRILEQDLIARLKRPLLLHPAVAYALAARPGEGDQTIADIQRQSGYSPRHFFALFRAAVGLTPKHYARVRRFGAVARVLAGADPVALADLAAAAGYADQPRLTREFRAFAGVTPRQYRSGTPERPYHHRVGEAVARAARDR
jgi:AraC-like DNA-binding protein